MKKKGISLILAMAMLLGMTMNVGAAFDRSYTAPKGTPVIDGEIDDIWNTAEWTAVDKLYDTTRDTDSVCYVKLLWDESHLYFLANIYDTTENERNDLMEIYIDQDKKAAGEFEEDDFHTRFFVRKSGAKQDSGKNCQNDAPSIAKSLGDNKFLVEGQLEWKGGNTSVGDKIGLEFMYNDGTMFQSFMEAYRWNVDTANGDEWPFESTKHFGTLILAEAGTANEENSVLPAEADTDATGTGNVTVNRGDSVAKEDEQNIEKSDETVDEKNDEQNKGNAGMIIGIAAAIVVIAAIVILVIRKKKFE